MLAYGIAVRSLGGSQAAAFSALTPVLAAFGGAIFLDEPVGVWEIVAAVITGLGVALSTGILSHRAQRADANGPAPRHSTGSKEAMMNEQKITPRITQAMVEAYDEYTHLTLDRRSFMDKLTKLAGSGAAAAMIAPMLAANSAQAAIVAADDKRLRTKDVVYPGATGEIKGYRASPAEASGRLPAVIVIHENRGLNDHIRDVARRMALEGFVAIAPDLLSVAGGTPSDEEKAREMIGALDLKNGDCRRGGNDRISPEGQRRPMARLGVVGFCWGGGIVNDLAVNAPDLGAGVAYYGRQAKAEDVAKIKAPLLLQYAGSGYAHKCRHRRLQEGAGGEWENVRDPCL